MNTIDDETKQMILECISYCEEQREELLKEGKGSLARLADKYMCGIAMAVGLMDYELVIEEKDGSTNVVDIRRRQ